MKFKVLRYYLQNQLTSGPNEKYIVYSEYTFHDLAHWIIKHS